MPLPWAMLDPWTLSLGISVQMLSMEGGTCGWRGSSGSGLRWLYKRPGSEQGLGLRRPFLEDSQEPAGKEGSTRRNASKQKGKIQGES